VDENIASGVGGDDGVHPATGSAVADVGLPIVIRLHVGGAPVLREWPITSWKKSRGRPFWLASMTKRAALSAA
jgi:hypothetical protein